MDNQEARELLRSHGVITDPSDPRAPLHILRELGEKGILPLVTQAENAVELLEPLHPQSDTTEV